MKYFLVYWYYNECEISSFDNQTQLIEKIESLLANGYDITDMRVIEGFEIVLQPAHKIQTVKLMKK